jgi:hypothetical protein
VTLVHGNEKDSAESNKYAPRYFHESGLMLKSLALFPSGQAQSAQNPVPIQQFNLPYLPAVLWPWVRLSL